MIMYMQLSHMILPSYQCIFTSPGTTLDIDQHELQVSKDVH